MFSVSVIITSWNRSEVVDAIESVQRCTIGHDFEVVVSDNGSDAPLQDRLMDMKNLRMIDTLILRPPGDNQSWAAGMNEAVSHCSKEWATVPSMANDFLMQPGYMDAMERAINACYAEGKDPTKIQWAFAPILFSGELQPEGFGGYVYEPARYAHAPSDNPDYTGHGLIHASLWEFVGGYDTQFTPIYMEDVDWGIRLHLALAAEGASIKEAIKYPAIVLVEDSKIIHRKAHTVRGHGSAAWQSNRQRLLQKFPELV